MSQYGVHRLVAINSGNYSFANIDLTKPVHLAAPNNRGKSTLVNSLQFLYIDDFTKMKFGHRSHEDTRRHYFGADRSYLIFECLTTSGIQCMLVRGLSNLRGGQFERYVYDGEFRDADFLDDGEIRSFESIRNRLADRHLALVRNTDLWQVLAGSMPSDDGKALPRLNILPIRRRDEYVAFRDVFVRLLSLMNVNARTLRQLVIESHAREVGERKIDVAAEYKDEFDRAERSEHHLDFIRTVATDIDAGSTLRLEIQALRDKFVAIAPQVWNDALRCRGFFATDEQRLVAATTQAELDQSETRSKRDSLLIEQGTRQGALTAAEGDWAHLNAAHEKWSTYSVEFIKEMRENARRQAAEIAEGVQHLDLAGRLDLHAMRNRVNDLTRQIATDRKAVEQWEQTAAAELRRAGIADADITSAFQMANPSLLKLIIGDTLTIKDLSVTVERIRTIASRVNGSTYSDDAVVADLSGIAGPDATMLRDPEQLLKVIELTEQDLSQQVARLKVAENQEKARAALDVLRTKHDGLCSELAEYDSYVKAWSNRPAVEKPLEQAKQSVADIKREIDGLAGQLAAQAKEKKRLEQECSSLQTSRESLKIAARDFRQEAQRLALDGSLPVEGDQEVDDSARPKSLQRFAASVTGKLAALSSDLQRIVAGRSRLKELQDAIAGKSRQFETQQRYFNDEDAEWESLIESRDSLPQLEAATAKNWDGLFTTLGARLNAVVTAVSSIKTAVEGLNRGLKAYQVSNLRAVQIKLEEEHDTFSAVEALSSQGSLFQDRDAIDIAKKKLRQMIDRNEMIDLESLFELRIRIQQSDGTWQEAASLDEIGSTGTGMTVKAMIFIQLVRAIAGNEKFRLHFYIDGLGELDDNNLAATAAMAVSKGVIPITADPRLHLEPLAHPEVTVYGLGQKPDGRFYIDGYKTYHAHRRVHSAGDGHE
jgi:hypothetical protein